MTTAPGTVTVSPHNHINLFLNTQPSHTHTPTPHQSTLNPLPLQPNTPPWTPTTLVAERDHFPAALTPSCHSAPHTHTHTHTQTNPIKVPSTPFHYSHSSSYSHPGPIPDPYSTPTDLPAQPGHPQPTPHCPVQVLISAFSPVQNKQESKQTSQKVKNTS